MIKPPHLDMSDECYHELLRYYSQLPNPSASADLHGKVFRLRSLELTEDEIAQICKPKEKPIEVRMKQIIEDYKLEQRKLAKWNRERRKEEQRLVFDPEDFKWLDGKE